MLLTVCCRLWCDVCGVGGLIILVARDSLHRTSAQHLRKIYNSSARLEYCGPWGGQWNPNTEIKIYRILGYVTDYRTINKVALIAWLSDCFLVMWGPGCMLQSPANWTPEKKRKMAIELNQASSTVTGLFSISTPLIFMQASVCSSCCRITSISLDFSVNKRAVARKITSPSGIDFVLNKPFPPQLGPRNRSCESRSLSKSAGIFWASCCGTLSTWPVLCGRDIII